MLDATTKFFQFFTDFAIIATLVFDLIGTLRGKIGLKIDLKFGKKL